MPKQDYGVYKQFNCADVVRCAAQRNNKQNSCVSRQWASPSVTRSQYRFESISGRKFMEFECITIEQASRNNINS